MVTGRSTDRFPTQIAQLNVTTVRGDVGRAGEADRLLRRRGTCNSERHQGDKQDGAHARHCGNPREAEWKRIPYGQTEA